ncbi:N-terminal nucleophile aminohydrolase [Ramicandelaber brevisporus]|nr:N-terminal nucleophile aminohydrolase [Ramicandelaber brevisporus]
MASNTRYRFSLTTFSPEGKLLQIEHAIRAVTMGFTSVGIKAANGVVIATEKRASTSLVDKTTMERVSIICDRVGVVASGLTPDARVLIAGARKFAQSYRHTYGQDPPVGIIVKELASIMQEYTQSGGVRPFGVSLLVAGFDDSTDGSSGGKPLLYQVDPSGSYFPWKGTVIGKNMANAKTFLQKRYAEDMHLEDAVHTAILTLKEGFEGEMTADMLDIGIIGETVAPPHPTIDETAPLAQSSIGQRVFRRLTKAEITDYLANIA